MVGIYYSWEYTADMSDSIKTGIISVASKNGDYVKKHLYKNLTPKNQSSKISYDQTAATQGKFIQYSLFKIELMSTTHLVKLY